MCCVDLSWVCMVFRVGLLCVGACMGWLCEVFVWRRRVVLCT